MAGNKRNSRTTHPKKTARRQNAYVRLMVRNGGTPEQIEARVFEQRILERKLGIAA